MARIYSRRPAEDRFWEKVDSRSDAECWGWMAYVRPDGYAQLRNDHGARVYAHRFAYELLIGPIPDGLDIDHLCRNRRCVNPAHMEPVTRQVNLLRGTGATATRSRQTHCKHGHSLADAYINKRGNRDCRVCRCEGELRRYHARKRAS